MPIPFSRTLRSLESDTFHSPLWALGLITLLLAASLGWFVWATVPVYETTENARLETERSAHPVTAAVSGRVKTTHLVLGRKVTVGDVLIDLEDDLEALQLIEETARFNSFTARHEALQQQIVSEERAWPGEQKTARLAVEEARAHLREAEVMASFADGEVLRLRRLYEDKLVSESELRRGEAEADRQRSERVARSHFISKLESEAESKERNQLTRLAELQREVALLEGERKASQASIKRFQFVMDQRHVRATVSGELGEIASLSPGTFVTEGQQVGAIIPEGQLRLVAHFSPISGLGRIQSGQLARLRLHGFSWTRYGTFLARVVHVAHEPREGLLRVELELQNGSTPLVRFQHGLSGTVEVQVERLSPAALVFRAAGKFISRPLPAFTFLDEAVRNRP